MKTSFLFHNGHYSAIQGLTFEEKGLLFDAICRYNFEGITPDLPPILGMAFGFMKVQFDMDSVKYEKICERNKSNGKKGGRPNDNPDEPKKPTGLSGNPKNPDEPKKPDNDNDNDNDNDSDNDNDNGSDNGSDLRKRKIFSPPSLPDFEKYFIENGYSPELANRAYKGYEVANWKDSKGNQIKNWRQKCQHVWFRPENKSQKPINGAKIDLPTIKPGMR